MGNGGQTQQVINGPVRFVIISSCSGGWGLGWLGVCQGNETEQCSRSAGRSGSSRKSEPAAKTRSGASRGAGHGALPRSVSSLCLHFGDNPGTFLPH